MVIGFLMTVYVFNYYDGYTYFILLTPLGLASAGVRIPLFGTESYGLINFPYLPTEVSFFADGGVSWTESEAPVLKWESGPTAERIPVCSAGVSTRFNLFGYTVLEIYYARPFQRPVKGAHFGFQLVPGW